jgi:hypothetical protein
MELFKATGKPKNFIDAPMLRVCVGQKKNEYRIDVCYVTRGAHIEHLLVVKKTFSVFLRP